MSEQDLKDCLKQTRKTIIEYLDGVWDGGKDGWTAIIENIDGVLGDGGAVVSRILTIPAEELKDLNNMLEQNHGFPDESEVIKTFTVDFGHGIEADIKVVNGTCDEAQNTGPYVDPVLFANGSEVCVIEPDDQLDGEYIFWYDSNKYIVLVRGE